jgi:hypothetical protein
MGTSMPISKKNDEFSSHALPYQRQKKRCLKEPTKYLHLHILIIFYDLLLLFDLRV